MTYKDTILQMKDIKWRTPKMKVIEDGNADIRLTIPLTRILELQAFRAFNAGILAFLEFTTTRKDMALDEFTLELEKQIKIWRTP